MILLRLFLYVILSTKKDRAPNDQAILLLHLNDLTSLRPEVSPLNDLSDPTGLVFDIEEFAI